ncbi:hypothetical protein DFH11DRAFT_901491 [Phellopilus nigrolimitatus]|nr:hypothetical protein DFH11DRAFT_901491 [Phellopilus nigrolimitatus]
MERRWEALVLSVRPLLSRTRAVSVSSGKCLFCRPGSLNSPARSVADSTAATSPSPSIDTRQRFLKHGDWKRGSGFLFAYLFFCRHMYLIDQIHPPITYACVSRLFCLSKPPGCVFKSIPNAERVNRAQQEHVVFSTPCKYSSTYLGSRQIRELTQSIQLACRAPPLPILSPHLNPRLSGLFWERTRSAGL